MIDKTLANFIDELAASFGPDREEEMKLRKQDKEKDTVRIQRPWKIGKCYHCGHPIYIIDDFTPSFCPVCHWSRVD